jgi:hypothetical protein
VTTVDELQHRAVQPLSEPTLTRRTRQEDERKKNRPSTQGDEWASSSRRQGRSEGQSSGRVEAASPQRPRHRRTGGDNRGLQHRAVQPLFEPTLKGLSGFLRGMAEAEAVINSVGIRTVAGGLLVYGANYCRIAYHDHGSRRKRALLIKGNTKTHNF